MINNSNYKKETFITIDKDHWENNWKDVVTERSLSLLNVFNYDAIKLLTKNIDTHQFPSIIEIGFVPGKFLHYLERKYGAICHGYDYSESGCSAAQKYLSSQGANVQIHCQDVLIAPPSATCKANLVYSIGVVEHFSDPTGMIHAHLEPLADDGVCLIILPNYSGFNYKLQMLLDPENLAIHNLESMTHDFWERYALRFPNYIFKTYVRGRINPWMYSLQKFGRIGWAIQFGLNFMGFIFPPHLQRWAGMFVIEIRKK